jgi:hypothetical protein
MQAGDTFYLPDKAADGHLWVVISEPAKNPDRILLVSMTSYDVERIRRGVSLSRRIDLEHIELMEEQELLD